MNSKNSKISDPNRLLLKLSGKINLKRSDKYVSLSNLNKYYTWKNIKKSYKNNTFKLLAPIWRIWITWWIMFCIRYSRLFWMIILKKKHEEKPDNPSIRIYINKIEIETRLK